MKSRRIVVRAAKEESLRQSNYDLISNTWLTLLCAIFVCRRRTCKKDQLPMKPMKVLLMPGEVAPHPHDPVEQRRLNFQTPGQLRSTTLSSRAVRCAKYALRDSRHDLETAEWMSTSCELVSHCCIVFYCIFVYLSILMT